MSSSLARLFRNRPRVIVKAFRGEPVLVSALADLGDVVEVFGKKEDVTICLPRTSLYKFEESVFRELRSAYEVGDKKKLEDLWAVALVFENTCHEVES